MMDIPDSLVQEPPTAAGPPEPDPGKGNLAMAAAEMAPQHAANGENYLQQQRSRFGDEMEANPAVRSRLRSILSLENENAGPGVVESLMNRMSMTGGTLAQGMGGGANSFYGPVRKGLDGPRAAQIERSPIWKARLDQSIDQALAGSNVVKGHTDQGSVGDPNYYTGGVGVNIAGERFNHWGGYRGQAYSAAWTADQQAKVAAGAPYTGGAVGVSDIPADVMAKARTRMEDKAGSADFVNRLYQQGGGGMGIDLMRAGAVPPVGELAEGPSTNIEHREDDEGPIKLPSDLEKGLQTLGMRMRALNDDKMAKDLGMDDIQALLDKYVPKQARRR